MIRTLTFSDFNDAIEISILRDRISGIKTQFDIDTASSYFSNNSEGKIAFGYFEDNKLISWIGIKLHENKKRGKFWVIPFFFSKHSTNYFSFNNEEIRALFQKAFAYAEELGYYDFYYSVGKRVMNVYERQWKKNNFLSIGRYELITLDTIPPNTKPDVEMYWLLMNKQITSETIVIKKRSLKEYLKK